ncbi:hypothetical protein V2S66_03850 [Streptomyces sp. V4-01]|uniref:DUF2004 domain-containing protein n=1 Tax=Actinacidiphila polyblastidii TaxID=3110430 RepID=A0ABU7P7N9_9ACTN|nr:hypothetical protein [Streptomyces sp. V4-01]
MFLEEILADKPTSSQELASWAARGFGIPDSAVVVESEDDRGGALGDDIELLVETGELAGDFPAHLSFFARSARTEAAERDVLVADFARRFQAHLLVSDDSPDPYRMTLVKPDGSRELVRLNVEALDSEDAYVIDGPYVPEEEEDA